MIGTRITHTSPRALLLGLMLALALAGSRSTPAWAQIEDELDLDDAGLGGEVPAGAAEDPKDPPQWDAPSEEEVEAKKSQPKRTGYPIEQVLRPIMLDPGMAEISSETPLYFSPVRAAERLRVRYGINDRVEFGLRYTMGAVIEDGFTAGKAVAVDTQVHVFDWLAVQVSLPILLDPFAMGVGLGAPMKFGVHDKVALFFGRDLLSFRVSGFVPVIEDPLVNEELSRQRDANTILPRGDVRMLGGVIYQIDPDLALTAEIGVIAKDFGISNSGVPLSASLLYSTSKNVDLGGRLGFDDLDQGADTFGITLLAAFRL